MSPDLRPQPFDPSGDDLPEALDPTRSEAGPAVLVLAEAGGAGDREWSGRAALRVARSWAGAGRRIFMADLSLDEPLLHDLLGEPNREGISDAVLYGASVRRIARAPAGAGFYFAPAGTVVADPAEVLGHERWDALAEGFRGAGATLVLFLPTALAGADRLLERADEVVVLGEADGAAPEGRVRAVLVPPAAGEAADATADAAADLEVEEDLGSTGGPAPETDAERADEPTSADDPGVGGFELEDGFGDAPAPEEDFGGALEPEPAPESEGDVDWDAGLDSVDAVDRDAGLESEGEVDWGAGLDAEAAEPEDDLPAEPTSGAGHAPEEPTEGGADLGTLEPGAGEPFDALAAFETEPEPEPDGDPADPLRDEDDPGADLARMEAEAAAFAHDEAAEGTESAADPAEAPSAEPDLAAPAEPESADPAEPADPAGPAAVPPAEPDAAAPVDEGEVRPGEGDPLFPSGSRGAERTRTSRTRTSLLVLLLVVVLGGAVLAWYYGVVEVPGVPPAEEVVGAVPSADAALSGTPARASKGGGPSDPPPRA